MQNRKGEKICFLLLPGFAPDTKPLDRLTAYLTSLGYPVIASNFWGSTQSPNFETLTIADCIVNIKREIDTTKAIHESVVGIGISLGGALLIEYAKQYQNLTAITSIGTPFILRRKGWIKAGLAVYPFAYPFWKILDRVKRFRFTPLGCARVVINYFEHDLTKDLSRVKTPTLLIHSKRDTITDHTGLTQFAPNFGGLAKISLLENGTHVVSHDPEIITQQTLAFLRTL